MSRCILVGASLASLVVAVAVAHADSQSDPSPPPAALQREQAIVGGSDVPAGKWPDTVAVLGKTGVCSGTLIAPDVVLTAGHCADITPTYVIANTTNYAVTGGAKVAVARTVAYPNWDKTYDISLIMLSQPINSVTPRRIGTACTYAGFAADTLVRLVGFGATDAGGASANTHLKEAMTLVVDPTCSGPYGCNHSVQPGGEFVAGGSGTADSCFGDSGGPVYLETERGPIVIGAVSRGVNNAATPCGGGGIYVRTDKIIQWIEDTAGKAVMKDECIDETAAGSDSDTQDPATDEVGCNAAGAGSGSLAFGALALGLALSRRRRR